MLYMSLRDPRVSKAVQVAFVAMSALWLVNFSTQETHSTFSWVLLPLNIAVLVGFLFLLVARHLEAHRVEAHRAHQHSVRLNPANIERTFWSPKWSRTRDHLMELNGTRRHAWPQFQIQINTWTDRPSPINAGTRRNSLVSKTANGTGINPAVRLKGHSARLPSGLLISPPSRQGFRPSPAAISSSLLLIPGLRGRGSRGAEPSTFCAPFAWLERKPQRV